MTYCVGWRDNKSVYIVADSAVSFKIEYKDELSYGLSFSSFGELHEEHSRYYVEEGKLKINNIMDQVIIGSAGSVDEIENILESIEESLNFGISIRKALEIVMNSVTYNNAQLLIGFIEDQRPILLCFDTKEIHEGDILHIGSGIEQESWTYRMDWFIEESIKMRATQRKFLTAVVSILQSYAMRERMMPLGVGGIFTGTSVSSEGVIWCDDITYYIFRDQLTNFDGVTVIHRDDSLFLASSFNSAVMIFPGRKHLGTIDLFLDKWRLEAERLLRDSKTDHFVFTSPFYPPVILVQIDGKIHNNYFRMWKKEEGTDTKYTFAFTSLIYDALEGKGFSDDEELFFNWLIAEEIEYVSRRDLIIARGHQHLVDDFEGDFL